MVVPVRTRGREEVVHEANDGSVAIDQRAKGRIDDELLVVNGVEQPDDGGVERRTVDAEALTDLVPVCVGQTPRPMRRSASPASGKPWVVLDRWSVRPVSRSKEPFAGHVSRLHAADGTRSSHNQVPASNGVHSADLNAELLGSVAYLTFVRSWSFAMAAAAPILSVAGGWCRLRVDGRAFPVDGPLFLDITVEGVSAMTTCNTVSGQFGGEHTSTAMGCPGAHSTGSGT